MMRDNNQGSNKATVVDFYERTTTVPAILSCQPCFFASKATQINPKPMGNEEM